jgi:DNA-directed RNA polymerase specialized sigma24 family protein
LNNISQVIIEYRCMPEDNLVSIAGELRHYRRKKVLELGLKGMNQAQIAAELGISLSTVKRTFYTIRKTCRIKELNNE